MNFGTCEEGGAQCYSLLVSLRSAGLCGRDERHLPLDHGLMQRTGLLCAPSWALRCWPDSAARQLRFKCLRPDSPSALRKASDFAQSQTLQVVFKASDPFCAFRAQAVYPSKRLEPAVDA